MGGFIILTSYDWLISIKKTGLNNAIFWRKKKTFKAIESNDSIYFLKRGHFSSNYDRYIVGKGTYISNDYGSAENVWERYNKATGYLTKESFMKAVYSIYKEPNPNLGCIIIKNIIVFPKGVSLAEAGISLSPYTVSGKTISQEECDLIDKLWRTI